MLTTTEDAVGTVVQVLYIDQFFKPDWHDGILSDINLETDVGSITFPGGVVDTFDLSSEDVRISIQGCGGSSSEEVCRAEPHRTRSSKVFTCVLLHT